MPNLPSPLTAAAAIALALGLAGPAIAQGSAGMDRAGPSATTGAPGAADRDFVTQAAVGGLAEVQLGQLAQRQGSSSEVKQFGAQMVQDHSAANAELQRIAASKGLQPPASLDAEHTALAARLQKLSGADFDREYAQAMLDDHKKTVALFEKQTSGGQDADLRGFAQKTLPTLRQHLAHVQGLTAARR